MYTAQRKVDADFSNKIILSDAAHFHLDGFENSQVIVEKQMHPQRITVWYGFWVGGIIRQLLFENAARQTITVKSDCYRDQY